MRTLDRVVTDAAAAGFSGFIVPDLPWDEGLDFRAQAEAAGLTVIQLVTPVTPDERLRQLTAGEEGFVYAVTVTGITGAPMEPSDIDAYLARVRGMTG